MTADTILLCTVGGSHQPILKAIEETAPDFVCFFCTGKNPATGQAGSIRHVTGKGNVIREDRDDPGSTLPNIPTQAGLDDGRFEARQAPADDLDGCVAVMRAAIAELAERFPEARFVADYTGGTKSMTAALVCAALEADGIGLQLIAGARASLDGVRPSTESAMPVSLARLRLDRALAPYLGAWRRFAYREAADGLKGIRIERDLPQPDRHRLQQARDLSRAFAAWDDFDHKEAFSLIESYKGLCGQWPALGAMLSTLRRLTHDRDRDTRTEPARIHDLWLNAERRAAQGRYDDAVARAYRMIEWTAQWQLRSKHGIDTADMPADWIPRSAQAAPGRDGKLKVGLWQSWLAIGQRLDGPAREFMERHGSELRARLDLRNDSILAHGFRPVGAGDWEEFLNTVQSAFLPMFRELASEAGLKSLPEQLPAAPPAFVRRGG